MLRLARKAKTELGRQEVFEEVWLAFAGLRLWNWQLAILQMGRGIFQTTNESVLN